MTSPTASASWQRRRTSMSKISDELRDYCKKVLRYTIYYGGTHPHPPRQLGAHRPRS